MLQVFLFHVEYHRRVTRVDEPRRDLFGSFDCRTVFHFDCAVRRDFRGESRAEEYRARRLIISRPNEQSPPPIALEFIHAEFLQQSPMMNNADALGEPLYFTQNVTRHEDRDALIARQFNKQIADFDNSCRIQAIRRLVENEQFGIVQQRLGKSQSLRVAVR